LKAQPSMAVYVNLLIDNFCYSLYNILFQKYISVEEAFELALDSVQD
jgi:hypothetical protein